MTMVARAYRREPTRTEAILWQGLRKQQVDGRKFRRQHRIGPFLVDFFCPDERLIVEVDGPVHDLQRDRDRERQELIEALGFRFLRLTTAEVEQDLSGVIEKIQAAFLPSPPAGEGSGEGGPKEAPAMSNTSPSPEHFSTPRGAVPPDQPEVAEPNTPVEDHAPSHAGEPVRASEVGGDVPVHPRDDAEEANATLSVIGTRMRKTDGLSKSTGRARYTDDITLPGMLHGKILRSPHAHARILSIDTSEAEAMEGVHGVVTGAEMPTPYGIIVWTPDEQALATERVRYIGDAVAAVAAVDEDTANAAVQRIRVEYEVLEAILDPHEAVRRTDLQIHEAKREGHNGNISKIVKLEFGDVEGGLRDATWWWRATTSSRAPRTRPSSRTAPSGSGRRAARRRGGSPSGRPRRCPTTCTASWRACWSWTRPRCASSSPRSAAASAGSRSRSTWSSASRSWR
jgi:very-short-patch-repair endonuclease